MLFYFIIDFGFIANIDQIEETTEALSLINRPYSTKKYFLGNKHRNGVGDWYGYFVLLHATLATITIILVPIPAFITKKGSKFHGIFGILTIEFIILILMSGMFIIKMLELHSGGFEEYICNYLRDSFPVWNFKQFVYLLTWLMESLSYGVATAMWQNNVNMYKQRKYIYFVLLSTTTIFAIFMNLFHFFDYAQYWFCPDGIGTCVPCHNIPKQIFIFKMYGIAYTFELFTIILSIKNAKFIYKLIRCFINEEKIIEKSLWLDTHGRNMMIIIFIISWTYLANIAYKTDERLTAVAYPVAAIFAIITYLFQKFRKEVFHFFGQFMVITNFIPVCFLVVITPYFIYKTFTFDINKDIATFQERKYLDSHAFIQLFGGKESIAYHNEFGHGFSVMVVFHVFIGLLSIIFIPIPLYFTKKGGSRHKLFGLFALLSASFMYYFGTICGLIMNVSRGLHPCSSYITGQKHDTSFSYIFHLQVVWYYAPFMIECMAYGINLILYKTSIMPDIYKIILFTLSSFSIFMNIFRILFLFSIIVSFDFNEFCHETQGNAIWVLLTFIFFELPSSYFSFINMKYMYKLIRNNACAIDYDQKWLIRQHGKNLTIFSGIMVYICISSIFTRINMNILSWFSYFIILLYLYINTSDKIAIIWMKIVKFIVEKLCIVAPPPSTKKQLSRGIELSDITSIPSKLAMKFSKSGENAVGKKENMKYSRTSSVSLHKSSNASKPFEVTNNSDNNTKVVELKEEDEDDPDMDLPTTPLQTNENENDNAFSYIPSKVKSTSASPPARIDPSQMDIDEDHIDNDPEIEEQEQEQEQETNL